MFDISTWLAIESTRRIGCLMIENDDGASGKHNIHEKMISIPGSTSGYAYFNDATCNDHVTSNIDSTLTYSLGRLTGLRTHEFGHNQNAQHQFSNPQSRHRSIMSYSQDNTPFQGYRLAVDPYWVNSPGNRVEDHSWDFYRRVYGGEAAKSVEGTPTDPTDPTQPIDPNAPSGIVIVDGIPRQLWIDREGLSIPAGIPSGFVLVEGNDFRRIWIENVR